MFNIEKRTVKQRLVQMMCLAQLGLVTFGGMSVVSPGDVFAQDEGGEDDGMSFGVDEVEDVDPNSAAAQYMEEGKRLYKKEKYAEASLLFFKVLSQEEPGSEALIPEAEYELGKTLFRMELYQGALTYFGRVVDAGEMHPYYLQTLRGLVLLSDEIPSDQTLMMRLSAYASQFPENVPKKYRDSFAYLVGRYLYSSGEYEQALELLKFIKPSSKYYLPSRYISGVTHVGNYDAKQAVASFKDVLRPLTRKLEEGSLTIEERALLEQTWLGMARVFYSTGEYNKALKYYGLIPRKSPEWPKALFESSWAYFQLDLANKALGNLHTLNSPFFANFYSPEAPILAGVIFFYNCKYSRVRYELEEFEYSYLPVREEIDGLLAKYEDPAEIYTWLEELQKGASSGEDEQLMRILAASVDDKEIQRKIDLVRDIDKELEKLKEFPNTWRNSPLGTVLVQDSSVAKEFAISELGELVRARLERIQRELVDLNVNRERILFEVDRAERGKIEAELRAEMTIDSNDTKTKKVKVTDEQLYWTFDGEYWKDELGFYQFTVNSSCVR